MTFKCKYCEKEQPASEGHVCGNCREKLPLVQQLMYITAQMRELKRKRDEQRQLNK